MQVWWKVHSAIVGFSMKVTTVKFCARQDSCTVVTCLKFCSDMVPNYGVTQKPKTKNFPSNFNHNGKSFVKWAPGSTLVQAMACFLTSPSNYLNNCWLLSSGDFGIHLGHGWPQRTLFNKYVFGNSDLEFLFFNKTFAQSCRKIKIYYLLLNTEKTTENQAWGAKFNPRTARILTSHKGPTWACEAQVLSHLYVTIKSILLIMFDLINTRPKIINTSEYGSKLIVHFS